ncbi:MAG: GGDEF domain-containing protein [Lachnospiraceae bacterium]|nr:GGDEF domain-containing protein [Lachnospiraceae bacterium]
MNSTITKAKQFDKKQRREFYQSKYDYYKSFNRGLLIVSTIAYITFFFTDCGIYGRFAYETIIPRSIVLLPLFVFLFMYKKTSNYKIMNIASYFMVHIIIWLTDWSTYILPDREYAGEGMIVMNLIFVCAGFCAPFRYTLIAHCGLIVDILVANLFIKYDDVVMMLMFNVPCVVAVCVMHNIMEKVYLDHYLVNKKLEKLVVHDELTGVYNRNKLREISDPITEELNVANDIPVTLMIVDMDFFKKVNDKYGHEAGDIVLKHLAKVLLESVRTSDYVIRWGGEEFVIILTGCNIDRGSAIAEKIRVNVENSDNTICPATVSIGVTEYNGGSYHIAIECADKALYRAKTSGRNRVVVYNEQE